MLRSNSDTIAAIATPIGEGGISIVRVSGDRAYAVVGGCFRGRAPLSEAASHTAHVGKLADGANVEIDEVVCLVFRAPNSYTGEDVVEVSCHGGLYVTRRVLEVVLQAGARHAEPGEFTKRAFLNGRIDLSQAEAVADLIHARSEMARAASVRQMAGGLSTEISTVREQLIDSLGLLELELDFAEDGYELIDKTKVVELVRRALTEIEHLLETYKWGKVYKEGVKVVLSGAPNVGKSSLLNALLNENRAIVTEVPGTTRDVIEEAISIEGTLFRLIDTAGLRQTPDIVEQEGVRRTEKQIEDADLILFLLDASREITPEEIYSLDGLLKNMSPARILVVENKIDVPGAQFAQSRINSRLRSIKVSAKTSAGLDDLRSQLASLAYPLSGLEETSAVVTNSRHVDALERARWHLSLALDTIGSGASNEFVAVDLRASLDALGEIVGVVTTDAILENIFAKFCIGK